MKLVNEASIDAGAALTLAAAGTELEIKAESTTDNTVTVKAAVDGGGNTIGFGASAGFAIDDNTTSAKIKDGAGVTNAKKVTVSSTTTDTLKNEVEGGTGGGKAITVVAGVSIANLTTEATVGSGLAVLMLVGSGGVLNISATQTAKSSTKAKGASKGNISVGAALALNIADNAVLASLARSVSGATDVTVSASGRSESTSEATASAEGAKKADDPTAPKVDEQKTAQQGAGDDAATRNGAKDSNGKAIPDAASKDGNGNSVKVSVAAAIAYNSVSTSSTASIADGVTITATGAVKVSATANTDAKATSDGSAKIADADKSSNTFAVGVAVSVNDVDVVNAASIGNGNVTAAGITIEAVMKDVSGDKQHKYESEATSGASDGKVGIAGAFAGDFVDTSTSAVAKGHLTTTGGGEVKVEAKNDELIDAKATAKVVTAKTLGVGASIAVNQATNTVHASLDAATVNSTGAVILDAGSKSEVKSRTLSGAIAKKSGGDPKQSSSTENNGGGLIGSGAGAGAENEIHNTVLADIVNGSVVTATSVSLTAKDESDIQALGGALAAALAEVQSGGTSGTSTLILGASIAINSITNVARAAIDASTVNSSGQVALTAVQEKAKILAVTIAAAGALNTNSSGGGGGFAFQGAASGSGNTIDTTVEALIRNGSHVFSGGGSDIVLDAKDKSDISADGGGVALVRATGSAGAVSIGASIAINDITAHVRSAIDASRVGSAKNLTLTAKSEAKIFALTIALAATNTAGGDSSNSSAVNFSGAGAFSKNDIESHSEATISDSTGILEDHDRGAERRQREAGRPGSERDQRRRRRSGGQPVPEPAGRDQGRHRRRHRDQQHHEQRARADRPDRGRVGRQRRGPRGVEPEHLRARARHLDDRRDRWVEQRWRVVRPRRQRRLQRHHRLRTGHRGRHHRHSRWRRDRVRERHILDHRDLGRGFRDDQHQLRRGHRRRDLHQRGQQHGAGGHPQWVDGQRRREGQRPGLELQRHQGVVDRRRRQRQQRFGIVRRHQVRRGRGGHVQLDQQRGRGVHQRLDGHGRSGHGDPGQGHRFRARSRRSPGRWRSRCR